ncbi:hypothetical protein D3C84_874990 [compost metagenome]
MKRICLVLTCLTVASLHAFGEDVKCKCNEVPFQPDPPCAKACIASIIEFSNINELIAKAALSKQQAQAINELRDPASTGGGGIKASYPDYPGSTFNQIEMKLISMPSDKLEFLVKTAPDEKQTVNIPLSQVKEFVLDKSIKNNWK